MCQGRSAPYIGDGHPTFNRESSRNGYINPYYKVDDHPYHRKRMGVDRPDRTYLPLYKTLASKAVPLATVPTPGREGRSPPVRWVVAVEGPEDSSVGSVSEGPVVGCCCFFLIHLWLVGYAPRKLGMIQLSKI